MFLSIPELASADFAFAPGCGSVSSNRFAPANIQKVIIQKYHKRFVLNLHMKQNHGKTVVMEIVNNVNFQSKNVIE